MKVQRVSKGHGQIESQGQTEGAKHQKLWKTDLHHITISNI